MSRSLLSTHAVTRWYLGPHHSPAGEREGRLGRNLWPSVPPPQWELEQICAGHIREAEDRVLLLVGTLLAHHEGPVADLWRDIYETVAAPGCFCSDGEETAFLERMTAAARKGDI